jgi:hypothetical protein
MSIIGTYPKLHTDFVREIIILSNFANIAAPTPNRFNPFRRRGVPHLLRLLLQIRTRLTHAQKKNIECVEEFYFYLDGKQPYRRTPFIASN